MFTFATQFKNGRFSSCSLKLNQLFFFSLSLDSFSFYFYRKKCDNLFLIIEHERIISELRTALQEASDQEKELRNVGFRVCGVLFLALALGKFLLMKIHVFLGILFLSRFLYVRE